MRGGREGDGHGGAFLVDLEKQSVRPVLDWNTMDLAWENGGPELGLRGIAIHGETVFMVASDQLLAFDTDFRLLGAWRNPWLGDCQEIATWQDNLFLTSSAYDSILAFDIARRKFHWAMQVDMQGANFKAVIYDPGGDDGPLMLNKLKLNNVVPTSGGLYLSGVRSGGMLHFNGQHVRMAVSLSTATQNAQPFRDGVLFNDIDTGHLRYAARGERNEDRALPVPRYDPGELTHTDTDDGTAVRQGYARGLSVLSERVVAGGSSPSTVTLYDLNESRQLMSVRITNDVRHAIHGLEPWPFD